MVACRRRHLYTICAWSGGSRAVTRRRNTVPSRRSQSQQGSEKWTGMGVHADMRHTTKPLLLMPQSTSILSWGSKTSADEAPTIFNDPHA